MGHAGAGSQHGGAADPDDPAQVSTGGSGRERLGRGASHAFVAGFSLHMCGDCSVFVFVPMVPGRIDHAPQGIRLCPPSALPCSIPENSGNTWGSIYPRQDMLDAAAEICDQIAGMKVRGGVASPSVAVGACLDALTRKDQTQPGPKRIVHRPTDTTFRLLAGLCRDHLRSPADHHLHVRLREHPAVGGADPGASAGALTGPPPADGLRRLHPEMT